MYLSNEYWTIKWKTKDYITDLVIFITKTLGIKFLTNGASTAPFHDPSFVRIQLQQTICSRKFIRWLRVEVPKIGH